MKLEDLPPFRPRAPWWGADLQTLRNMLRRDVHDEPGGERLTLKLADGGALVARLDRPLTDTRQPLAVVIHGLAGSEASFYMMATARHLVERGFPVLRLNLRGAGPSRGTSSGHYHAGKTDDLAQALAGLPPALTGQGILLLGYSLGGNMLLKYLGEGRVRDEVLAAASISAPVDLAATARRILAPRNRIYQRYVLRAIKRETLALDLTAAERSVVASARSVLDFDERFIAPRFGYRDAWDYYAHNSARPFLPTIRQRTLVIHSFDDPWIPASSYRAIDWEANPAVSAVLTRRGGHVGYHGVGSAVPWHDRVVAAFFSGFSRP